MGAVYEATQLSLGRTVALKLLASHLSDDDSFRERFRREGRIQAQIDHPNIVTVYEAGESEHGLFLAMRLVRGPNLKDMIVSRELDAGRSLRILAPIADALDTAHSTSLIHRDIKPQNILVSGRDHSYLADFGLTKALGDAGGQSLTKTGQFVGTLDYISPEQIRGNPATERSDIYALAGVLYECLTGSVPFPKDSEAALLYAHMSDEPPKVTEQRPELPELLDGVLTRSMSKDPEERHATASELIEAAEHAFGRRIRAAISTPGPIETPEETGIRPAEGKVQTRETRTPDTPAPAGATRAGKGEETRFAGPDETRLTEAEETKLAEAEATKLAGAEAGADATQLADAEATRLAEADSTRLAEVDATRLAEPVEPDVTRAAASPAETRLAQQGATAAAPAATAIGATADTGAAAAPTAPPAARPTRIPPAAIAATAGLALALAAVGFIVGGSGGGGEEAPEGTTSASAGAIELSFPTSWDRISSTPDFPGLAFRDPISLAPTSAGRARGLVAGTTGAGDPSLLPDTFTKNLEGGAPEGEPVRIGQLEALRYTGLQPRGFEDRLTMYVAATSEGVATAACFADPAEAARFLPECESAVSSLVLTGGAEPYPLGGREEYAQAVDKAIGDLSRTRASGLKDLKSAKAPAGQEKAAGRVEDAYNKAARALAGFDTSPAERQLNEDLAAALRRAGEGWSALASAAGRGNRSAYSNASKRIKSAEASVNAALGDLEQLGFSGA